MENKSIHAKEKKSGLSNKMVDISSMNFKRKKNSGLYIRRTIAAIAAINLILLFVFDYRVPVLSGMISEIESNRYGSLTGISVNNLAEEGQETEATIQFDEESLSYNGEGKLNLLDGVVVSDVQGNILSNDNITTKVLAGSKKKKTVEYIYSDNQGNKGEASRTLKLIDYAGPSIEFKEGIPNLNDEDVNHLGQTLHAYVAAVNGYGKDITSKANYSIRPSDKYDGTFVLTVSVTNEFGDDAKTKTNVKSEFTLPHLSLLQKDTSLKKGDKFLPQEYIRYAVAADGTNLTEFVQVEGEVDTSKVGDYIITYSLVDKKGLSAGSKTLTVHVAEN